MTYDLSLVISQFSFVILGADGKLRAKEFRVGTGVSKNRRGLWVEQILVLVAAGQGKNGLTAIWRYFGFEFFDFGY